MQRDQLDDDYSLGPADEIALMDDVQTESNKAIASLLPCDPCLDAMTDGVDAPEDAEPMDIGLGVESDLYDL